MTSYLRSRDPRFPPMQKSTSGKPIHLGFAWINMSIATNTCFLIWTLFCSAKNPASCFLCINKETLHPLPIYPNSKKPWTSVSWPWRENMFDVAVLMCDLEYCRTYIQHVSESTPSWFCIIGKLVSDNYVHTCIKCLMWLWLFFEKQRQE